MALWSPICRTGRITSARARGWPMRRASWRQRALGGGGARCELVERLTDAEIPVVCHLGLTPQAVHRMGGYKVQGKTLAEAEELARDARMLEAAGAVAI